MSVSFRRSRDPVIGAPFARPVPGATRILPWRASSRVGPIGVDFGTERVNLVQFAGGPVPAIRAALSVPYSTDRDNTLADREACAELLRPTLERGGFRGRCAVAALPPNLVDLRFLTYTRAPGQEEGDAVLAALREQFDGDLGAQVVDFLPIRAKQAEQSARAALVAVAARAAVLSFLDTLRHAGLDAKALEVGPVAIKRLLVAIHGHVPGSKVMAINFGTSVSFVTVLWERDLLLDRHVDFGADSVLGALSRAFDIEAPAARDMLARYGIGTGEDARRAEFGPALLGIVKPAFMHLANQIKKMLVYTAAETRGGAIDCIYLLGSVARWQGVDTLLSTLVDLPVRTINPFYGFEVSGARPTPMPGIAVATGLALRGLPIPPLP